MRALQNLRIKNGIFVFRRKVPHSLQALIQRREIIRSLGRCDARQARLQAARLWVATEKAFNMLTELQNGIVEDADLVGPDQVTAFIDTMIKNSHYNDEYTASVYDSAEIRRLNPFDRRVLALFLDAKRRRAQLVENDISEVVDEIQELSAELKIPIRRGSMSEKIIGREMLRAIANYDEGRAHRECKERGIPEYAEEFSRQSLEELRKQLGAMMQTPQALTPLEVAGAPVGSPSIQPRQTIAPVEKETNFRRAKFQKKEPEVHDLDPNTPVTKLWQHYLNDRINAGLKDTRKLTSSLNLWTALHGDFPRSLV